MPRKKLVIRTRVTLVPDDALVAAFIREAAERAKKDLAARPLANEQRAVG